MENYFREVTMVKEFLIKPDRCVYLVQGKITLPNYPQYFVLKVYNSKEIPKEVQIHLELSNSDNSILRVYDHWEANNYYYMSIEYCENGDLHAYLNYINGQVIGLELVLRISYQLALTVYSMHIKSIFHRDIKPLNIYMKDNYSIFKLGDFGEAKKVDGNVFGFHTTTGTPYYMSPEMKENLSSGFNQPINLIRDELWALGKTFLEISLSRLCPETSKMTVPNLHAFIDQGFLIHNNSNEFRDLIKRMMQDAMFFNMNSHQVLMEIHDLYTRLYPETIYIISSYSQIHTNRSDHSENHYSNLPSLKGSISVVPAKPEQRPRFNYNEAPDLPSDNYQSKPPIFQNATDFVSPRYDIHIPDLLNSIYLSNTSPGSKNNINSNPSYPNMPSQNQGVINVGNPISGPQAFSLQSSNPSNNFKGKDLGLILPPMISNNSPPVLGPGPYTSNHKVFVPAYQDTYKPAENLSQNKVSSGHKISLVPKFPNVSTFSKPSDLPNMINPPKLPDSPNSPFEIPKMMNDSKLCAFHDLAFKIPQSENNFKPSDALIPRIGVPNVPNSPKLPDFQGIPGAPLKPNLPDDSTMEKNPKMFNALNAPPPLHSPFPHPPALSPSINSPFPPKLHPVDDSPAKAPESKYIPDVLKLNVAPSEIPDLPMKNPGAIDNLPKGSPIIPNSNQNPFNQSGLFQNIPNLGENSKLTSIKLFQKVPNREIPEESKHGSQIRPPVLPLKAVHFTPIEQSVQPAYPSYPNLPGVPNFPDHSNKNHPQLLPKAINPQSEELAVEHDSKPQHLSKYPKIGNLEQYNSSREKKNQGLEVKNLQIRPGSAEPQKKPFKPKLNTSFTPRMSINDIKIKQSISGAVLPEVSYQENLHSPYIESTNKNPFSPNLKFEIKCSDNLVNPEGLSTTEKKCCVCFKVIMDNFKQLPCFCYTHIECLKTKYEERLILAKTRIDRFTCFKCRRPIEFEYFACIDDLSPAAKIKSRLLMLSYSRFYCERDRLHTRFKMLSKNLKARDKRCEICKILYCTFCGVKGGHRFYCDLLKDLKNNLQNLEKFIKK